jgi:hypothetical protein
MQNEAYVKAGFGEAAFHNVTNVHPTGLVALAFALVITLTCKRKNALLPLFCITFLLPSAQRVVLAGLDFSFPRLMLLGLAVRATARGEWRRLRPTGIDRALFTWAGCAAAVYVIRNGSTSALIFKLGESYDLLGLYWITRNYTSSAKAVLRTCKWLAGIGSIAAILFAIEKSTGRNLFSVFGGAPEFTKVREGRLRCQGPYVHPILAGALWAGFIPPLLGARRMMRTTLDRLVPLVGTFGAFVIIFACASSTPLLGVMGGLGFMSLWTLRAHVPLLRRAVLAGLVVIHFARARPAWQLIAMAGVVGGSTGYHRYQLVDAFIRRWPEWFLLGTSSTAHWGHFLFDLANQFVREGVEGGFMGLLTFVIFVARTFALAGALAKRRTRGSDTQFLAWALGTAFAAHCVMFIGISISHSPPNILGFLLPSIWLQALAQDRARSPRPGNTTGTSGPAVSASTHDRTASDPGDAGLHPARFAPTP